MALCLLQMVEFCELSVELLYWATFSVLTRHEGLTVVADLAAIDRGIGEQSLSIFHKTFVKAQKYNLQMQKTVLPNWEPETYYAHSWPSFPPGWRLPPFITTSGFLNDYYDDEGWWALGIVLEPQRFQDCRADLPSQLGLPPTILRTTQSISLRLSLFSKT